jgi:hypothetical protein
LKTKSIPGLALLFFLSLASVPLVSNGAFAAASSPYVVTIQTNRNAYVGGQNQTIVINGTISPALLSASNLTITITNPERALVANMSLTLPRLATTYSYSFVPSSLECGWITGTYNVTATLVGSTRSSTTFSYAHGAPAATASNTSSITCTTTANTPEFGNQALLLVMLICAGAVSFVAKTTRRRVSQLF